MLSDNVISDIKSIINSAKEKAIRAVDTERVLMYWHIGQRIFLEEQEGKDRADYGKYIVKQIAYSLEPEFGTGYSEDRSSYFDNFIECFQLRIHCIRN